MNSKEIRDVIDSLRFMISEIVDQKINELPVTIPAKVLARDGVTVSAVPCMAFGKLTPTRIDGIPIMKSKYLNEPVKAGDFGLLVPASFFYAEIVTADKSEIETAIPTMTAGNYLFLPISQAGADFSDGIDTELWSNGGAVHLRVKESQIELNGSTGYATEHTALNTALQTFITALNLLFASKLDGAGTPGTLALNITAAKAAKVRL